MKKKQAVVLTATERPSRLALIAAGPAPARKLTHARVVLKADQGPDGPGWVEQAMADAVAVSHPTIARMRQQQVREGLEAARNRRPPRRVQARKLAGNHEAHLIALTCRGAPTGRARWSLRLLADKRVALDIVEEVSSQTVRRVLKKTS